MVDALRDIPSDFMPTPQPISHSFPGHARGVLGNVGVLSQWIELAPLLITASGVTVIIVVAVLVVAAAVSLTDRDPTKEECDEERRRARDDCIEELAKPHPSRERIGPRMTLTDCIESNIHEACGGKKVDREKSPRPGARY